MAEILPRYFIEYLLSGLPVSDTVPTSPDPDGPEEPVRDVLLAHDAALRAALARAEDLVHQTKKGYIDQLGRLESKCVDYRESLKAVTAERDAVLARAERAEGEVRRKIARRPLRVASRGRKTVSEPAVLIVKKGDVAPATRDALRRIGVYVIESNDPASVRFLKPGLEFSAGDLAYLAMKAISRAPTYQNETRLELGKLIVETVVKRHESPSLSCAAPTKEGKTNDK